MPSIELKVMQSYLLCCSVIKNAVSSAIQEAALKGEIQITHDTLRRINEIVSKSVDEAGRNGTRQMQSACSEK